MTQDWKEYRDSLPKGRGGTAWTIESFAEVVRLKHQGYSLVPGQEWKGNSTDYKILCPIHGEYETVL